MSDAYENVVGGKLKLKGKALDVKGKPLGVKKKKKRDHRRSDSDSNSNSNPDAAAAAAAAAASSDGKQVVVSVEEEVGDGGSGGGWDSNLTAAERRYVEQRGRIDMHRLAKTADKSHRDRIEDFNHYLANMSEHYDIPKVGPG